MFYIEVAGTPYEMGRQHGRALKLMIGSMIDYLGGSIRGHYGVDIMGSGLV